jgi:hypothetical protein
MSTTPVQGNAFFEAAIEGAVTITASGTFKAINSPSAIEKAKELLTNLLEITFDESCLDHYKDVSIEKILSMRCKCVEKSRRMKFYKISLESELVIRALGWFESDKEESAIRQAQDAFYKCLRVNFRMDADEVKLEAFNIDDISITCNQSPCTGETEEDDNKVIANVNYMDLLAEDKAGIPKVFTKHLARS